MIKKQDTFESFLNGNREQVVKQDSWQKIQDSFRNINPTLFSSIFQEQNSNPQNNQMKFLREKALRPFSQNSNQKQSFVMLGNTSQEQISPIDLQKKNRKIKSHKKFIS